MAKHSPFSIQSRSLIKLPFLVCKGPWCLYDKKKNNTCFPLKCSLYSSLNPYFSQLSIFFDRKLRRLRQNQILAYLCVSLLAAILLFTFGINGMTGSDSLDVCKAIAALLHYFLLSSIVWMSIEAYNLYQDLVKVFDTTFISQNEFMCRAGVVGWST